MYRHQGRFSISILSLFVLAACGAKEPIPQTKQDSVGVVEKITWTAALQEGDYVAQRLFSEITTERGHYVSILESGAVGVVEAVGATVGIAPESIRLVGFLSAADTMLALQSRKRVYQEQMDPQHQDQTAIPDQGCDGATGKALKHSIRFPETSRVTSVTLRKKMVGASGCLADYRSFGTDSSNQMVALLERAVASATHGSRQIPVVTYRQ